MSVTELVRPVLNPVIPYAGTIFGGLQPGEMVIIKGSVPKDSERFQIDFQCGSSVKPRADVSFHFNPRFKRSGCVVCNTLQQECWGREEITYEMPFKKGEPFETIILVLRDSFKVAVNGKHLLQYKHRVDLERVDTLGISGQVQIQAIGFVPNTTSTPPASTVMIKETKVNPILSSTPDLTVPYKGRLPNGLSPGQNITVRGEVSAYPHSFAVNLSSSDSSDIALHLNSRMKSNTFVRNSYLKDSWGPEETLLPEFPFIAGQYFEMLICCDPNHFKVAVNGVHLLNYKHRVKDLAKVNQLEIVGDVKLLDVKIW
ncbi:galectin-8-like isoform X2 [Polyodon spathula]|uniref:galectin-8-like isoform X2 n=1 Tax=Polyodon spathula TaxID=7913 RepID=UPI001B7F1CCF|nr:galectin-8-like isoform X2 [Polyodon spathula]